MLMMFQPCGLQDQQLQDRDSGFWPILGHQSELSNIKSNTYRQTYIWNQLFRGFDVEISNFLWDVFQDICSKDGD